MDQRQKQRAAAVLCHKPPRSGPWTLSRLQITSTLWPSEWPAARVELVHETLGSTLEIATGAGCLDAACNAVAPLFGVIAPIRSLEIQYEAASEATGTLPTIAAEVEVTIDGAAYRGSAKTGDLLVSAISAYLDALCQAAGPNSSREVQ